MERENLESQEPLGERVQLVPLGQIDPNPRQHRRVFTHIDELAQSIREKGVLVPIRVQATGERYRIVYGKRRFRAARGAHLGYIPCIVADSDLEIIGIKSPELFSNFRPLSSAPG